MMKKTNYTLKMLRVYKQIFPRVQIRAIVLTAQSIPPMGVVS